jgi:DNA-binding IclR family transcriptional regulator
VDLQEFHVGNSCVAAPVFDFRKAVMVAISASFISSRLEHEPLDRFAAAIVAGAQEVSLAMGCPP